jgi:hypothetical protein
MEKMHDYSCLLLIIDMQTGFYTAEDPVTVSSVVEELQFAWAFGNPVVVVTFKGQGELVAGVKELVEQLDSQVSIFFVEKTTDDGSALVAQALTEAGIASPQRLACLRRKHQLLCQSNRDRFVCSSSANYHRSGRPRL